MKGRKWPLGWWPKGTSECGERVAGAALCQQSLEKTEVGLRRSVIKSAGWVAFTWLITVVALLEDMRAPRSRRAGLTTGPRSGRKKPVWRGSGARRGPWRRGPPAADPARQSDWGGRCSVVASGPAVTVTPPAAPSLVPPPTALGPEAGIIFSDAGLVLLAVTVASPPSPNLCSPNPASVVTSPSGRRSDDGERAPGSKGKLASRASRRRTGPSAARSEAAPPRNRATTFVEKQEFVRHKNLELGGVASGVHLMRRSPSFSYSRVSSRSVATVASSPRTNSVKDLRSTGRCSQQPYMTAAQRRRPVVW